MIPITTTRPHLQEQCADPLDDHAVLSDLPEARHTTHQLTVERPIA